MCVYNIIFNNRVCFFLVTRLIGRCCRVRGFELGIGRRRILIVVRVVSSSRVDFLLCVCSIVFGI